MSNLPTITSLPSTDFTQSELDKIKIYKEQGLPGIAEVDDAKLYRMLELYLSGSTYSQIASMLRIKKVIVLYLAQSSNWCEAKQEYLNEERENIKNRVVDAKLRNSVFMLLLVQAWQKKLGRKLTAYLATGNDEHMDDIDLKEVAALMKAIDMVNDLDNTAKDSRGKTPAIGLNLGNGVIVEKTGENQVSITPKESTIRGLLQKYTVNKESESDIKNKKGVNDENQ